MHMSTCPARPTQLAAAVFLLLCSLSAGAQTAPESPQPLCVKPAVKAAEPVAGADRSRPGGQRGQRAPDQPRRPPGLRHQERRQHGRRLDRRRAQQRALGERRSQRHRAPARQRARDGAGRRQAHRPAAGREPGRRHQCAAGRELRIGPGDQQPGRRVRQRSGRRPDPEPDLAPLHQAGRQRQRGRQYRPGRARTMPSPTAATAPATPP